MGWLSTIATFASRAWAAVGPTARVIGIGGGLVGTVAAVRSGTAEDASSGLFGAVLGGQARGGNHAWFQGLYNKIELFTKMLQSIMGPGPMTNRLLDWSTDQQNKPRYVRDESGRVVGTTPRAGTPGIFQADSERPADARITPSTLETIQNGQNAGLVGSTVAAASLAIARSPMLASTALATATAGTRYIPLVGGAFAAASGLYDTGALLIRGEVAKAGVRFVSGVADTGFSLMGTWGVAAGAAAREGIEAGAEAAFGSSVALPDSDLARVGKGIGSYVWNTFRPSAAPTAP